MPDKKRSSPAARFEVVGFEAFVGANRLFVEASRPEMATGCPPIVFVGGAFDGSWICRQQLDYWASRGRPAYALNPRGYYRSRALGIARLTHLDYLDDILVVRRRFHLEDAVYAGYSMGGLLVQKLAEHHGARALVLYDSDWPREVGRMLGERPPVPVRLPPVMNFWPSRAIVEEMMGRPVGPGEFNELLALFKQSYLSGGAYRELELERIEIDAARVTCPVLTVSISARDRAQAALARYYGASRLIFEGYSHGSILISRFHGPITRRVTEWMEDGFPRGVTRTYRFKEVMVQETREKKVKLHYYTGWAEPKAHVCNRRGQELAQVPMRRLRRGRFHDEGVFGATIPFSPGDRLYLSCRGKEDRPAGRGCYDPLGKELFLMDGEFFPSTPPQFRQPPAYASRDIYSRGLAHHFKVNIMLPRDYGRGERGPYPVAVLNDGQNQWKNQGAHGGWHSDAIAFDSARRGRCRDIVLVSVFSHARRDSAYLPPPHGRADLYVDFLADTLLPALRKDIRISDSPGEIGIIGASYGANCALYAGMYRPDTFGLVGSLSFAHVSDDPVRRSMRASAALPIRRLYVDCGTRWAHDQPHRDDFTGSTRELMAIASEKGKTPGVDLLGIVAEGHYHFEVFWRKRIGRCLEFLYPLG